MKCVFSYEFFYAYKTCPLTQSGWFKILHSELSLMTTEDYKKISSTLPKAPGIYKFINEDDTILYVGKAKNLKNRLASYFGNKKHQMNKTRALVKNAHHIEFTIVETEEDALLLENTLIKKYQPRYNVN